MIESDSKQEHGGVDQLAHERQRLYRLARAQWVVRYVILFAIAMTLLVLMLDLAQASEMLTIPLSLIVQGAGSVLQLVAMYRLSQAVYRNRWKSHAFALVALVPCLGILVLLILNSKASRELRHFGYQVRVLGVNSADFQNPDLPLRRLTTLALRA